MKKWLISVALLCTMFFMYNSALAVVYIDSWSTLQDALKSDNDIILTTDIIASDSDTTLSVRAGKTVTLDLNGYKIDRNMRNITTSQSSGNVIDVNGTLILNDSVGTGLITGGSGYALYSGGIGIMGKLIMNGGTIASNSSAGLACGVANRGVFEFNGGSVTNNWYSPGYPTSETPAQIYNSDDTVFIYNGGIVTAGSTGSGCDIGINSKNDPINITTPLNSSTLYITSWNAPTATKPIILTSGLLGNGTPESFRYSPKQVSSENFVVAWSNNEAAAGTAAYIVTYQKEDNSVLYSQSVVSGGITTFPENIIDDTTSFEGWYHNDNLFDFSTPIIEDTVLTAKYSVTTPTPTPEPTPTPTIAPTSTPTPEPTPTTAPVTDFEYYSIDGQITISKYIGHSSEIIIPATIDDCPVISIGYRAFSNCTSVLSVVIPNSVNNIDSYVFDSCTNLYSLQIPDSVLSIGNGAFRNCSSLASIVLPSGLAFLGSGSFYNCLSLSSIIIPNSIARIEGFTFQSCSGLTSIHIPNSVNSIGEAAFQDCSSLSSIVIPESLVSIEDSTFAGCSSLTVINIPKSINSIGFQAFAGCSSLTNITIPSSVTSIGSHAFQYCSSLSYFRVPDSTTSIEDYTFSDCTSLSSITIPDGVTSIKEYAFFGCSSLSNIVLPNSIDVIGNMAFANCSSITSIIMPKRLTKLENGVFSGCYDLTSISIPETIISIGDAAFQQCTLLTSITVPASVTSIGEYAFDSVKKIYVPESVNILSVEAITKDAIIYCHEYSEADYWAQENGYPNIVYVDGDGLDQNRTIKLFTGDLTLPRGQSETISFQVFPDFDHPEVTWTTSDSAIATVENGTVTVTGRGTATITASVGSASASLTVTGFIAPESFDLIEEEWVLTKGTLQLNITNLNPSGADAVFEWTSADTGIATVDADGLVTAKRPGAVTVTATTNGISRDCLVHVIYPVTAVTFDDTEISVHAGEETQLTAHVTARDESFDNRLITFTSSDETVATVNETGLIHALKAGTATITATAESGVSASIECLVPPCDVHTQVIDPTVDPTCTETGLTQGVHCSVCGIVITPQETVPALGHDWHDATYTWTEDNSTVTATHICKRDETHTETETTTVTTEVTKPAACEEAGETTYSATFVNTAFAPQSKTLTDIPATGHDWGEVTYTWADDNKSVTASRVCKHDDRHVETETATVTAEVTKPAACEVVGETTYSAVFANAAFAPQSKTLADIPATGHDWGEVAYTWADDNKSVTASRVCKHDASHIEAETAAVTATVTKPAICEVAGETTYSAAFTNAAFTAQSKTLADIPATGHDWGEVTYTWAEDNKSVTASRVCSHDSSHVETETATVTSTVTKAATCEVAGETTYSAAFTNAAFTAQSKTLADIPATGHDWGEVTYTWAEDNKSVTASRVCSHDSSHVETETATVTSTVTKPATCEVAGETTYSASFTNEAFAAQSKTLADIPALGHDWGEVTYTWADDNQSVTASRVCMHDASHTETETATVTATVTKPATCEDAGETTYSASFTNEAFVAQSKTLADIPATGHDWSTPTYTWAEDNKSVTASRVCSHDGSHVETETATVTAAVTKPATCEAAGETTYSAAFANTAFAPQSKTLADIPATGHDWGDVNYTWASDNKSVTASRVCMHDDSHVETETATVTTTVSKPATCEVAGETTYSASFTNAAFEAQSKTLADIPATGHDWGTPTYTWTGDNKSVTASRVCSHDATHTETETATVTRTVSKPATCEAAGETTYSAAFANTAFAAQSKTLADIPATGHDWGDVTYTWAEDNKSVTASHVCSHDATHAETETATVTSTVTKAATCEETGETTYSAAFTNTAFAPQSKILADIPALGHDWGEVTYTWADDNKSVTASRVCKHDSSHVETETATVTATVTKPATCEVAGETTYTVAFTNTAFAAQSKTLADIPATGHDWDDVNYTWASDNKSVTASRVCRNDDSHVETETANVTAEVTKPATCEETGETTYSVAFTNTTFEAQSKTLADIPATGHDWGEVTYAWAEDNSTVTASRVCTHDASHTETETANVTAEVTKPATCEVAGETTYSAAFANTAFAAQSKTLADIPAIGHDWGEATYTWAEDNKSVTASRVCKHDASHTETETVTVTTTVTKPATCEVAGETTYSATFSNAAFTAQSKTLADIPAIGHDWGEVTYTWADDNKSVTASRVCSHDATHTEIETVTVTTTVTKLATCEVAGETTYAAAFANTAFEAQRKTLADIPATGHDWGTPTYTWTGDNKSVTASRVCSHDATHTETETATVTRTVSKPATCEVAGETTYSAAFTNAAFAAQSKTLADIPATGHTPVLTPGRLPTADAPGHTAGSTCSVCGKVLADHLPVESVQTLTLPAALRTVSDSAFARTAADHVLLPAGTTAIGSRAFADAPNLRFVTVPDSVTSIAPDAFEGCELVTFFCSDSSAAAAYAEEHGFAHTAP